MVNLQDNEGNPSPPPIRSPPVETDMPVNEHSIQKQQKMDVSVQIFPLVFLKVC